MKWLRNKFAFFFLLGISFSARGQESVTYFPIGARNASLANANIAESADISILYENPAALVFLENKSLFYNHSQDGTGRMQENLAIPLLLKNLVSIGLSLDVYHAGYLDRNISDDQRVLEYGYNVAFAAAVVPTLSFGGSATMHRGTTGSGTQAWGANFSVGADYAPTPDASYSMVYGGIGREIFYSLQDSALIAQSNLLQKTLEVGATMTYPSSVSFRSPIVILSFANEKVFGIKGLYYKGGIEFRPLEFLELRFGYVAGPNVSSARYGIGFLEDMFSLQYAIYPQQGTNILFQQFSATMKF